VLDGVDVVAPLFEALHFEGDVEVFLAFGFDDPVLFWAGFDDEVGVVV